MKGRAAALAALLPMLAGCDAAGPASGTPPPKARRYDPVQLSRGEAVYQDNCARCHGVRGVGTHEWNVKDPDGRYPPPPLDATAHAWHHSTAVLKKVIREGSPGGQGNMPAWQDRLSPREIDDVVIWITSLWPDDIYALWYREVEHRKP